MMKFPILGTAVGFKEPQRPIPTDQIPRSKTSRMMRQIAVCTAALAFVAMPAKAAIYKESGGVVVVEAEHFDARTSNADGHVWQIVPDENGNPNTPADAGFGGARGDKYMQSLPDTAGGGANYNQVAQVGGDPRLDIKVQISNPGVYRLYLRWGGYDGSSDSMYAQIVEAMTANGGSGPDWYRYVNNNGGTFSTWTGVGAPSTDTANRVNGGGGEVPAVFNLAAGTYTIRLGMREDGSAVDAICLQLASLPAPGDPGPPESLTTTQADTVAPTLVSARTAGNPNGVLLVFDEAISEATASNKDNFAINNGVTVNSSQLFGNNFTVLVNTTPMASGGTFTVTVNGIKDTSGNTIAANSTATFNQVAGVIERRVFDGITGGLAGLTNSAKFTSNQPDDITYPTMFEGPVNYRDNYGSSFRGYITAPVTGDYVFFISSDDPSSLYLSTDENPANKKLIAYETNWSDSRRWTSSGGGSDVTLKRSDQNANTQWPTGNTITLTAGQRYYVEVIHSEGTGGDNAGVTWMKPGDAEPVDGDPPIPGDYLSPFGSTPGPVTVAAAPSNTTVYQPVPATFRVVAGGSPPYTYQWYRNGVAIPGATGSTYTTGATGTADNGAKFSVKIMNPFSEVTSPEATLTVITDTTAPILYRAEGGPTMNTVTLVFSEAMRASSTNLANFSIPGLTINNATLANGGTNIVLSTSTQTTNTVYNVTVKDVIDFGPGLALSPNPTTVSFTGWVLKPGGALHKFWENIPANNIAGLTNDPRFPNNPTWTSLEPMFEWPRAGGGEGGSNYGNELSALLIPTETADYVFFVSADDPASLFLSTDSDPANKKLIAVENSWSNARQWNTPGGGASTVENKRSDLFAGSEWPTPNVINLEAGKAYYIQALHTEGGGGDNVGVTWIKAGDPDPANGSLPIGGEFLWTYQNPDVPTATISITGPTEGATFTPGTAIPFTVNATDPGGAIRKVTYYANGVVIGESTTAPFSFTWNNAAAGRYAITAEVFDYRGLTTRTATPVNIVVGNPPKSILYVHASGGPNATDNEIVAHLRNDLGFTVTTIGALASTAADATGKQLIIVSSTVGSGDVNTKFRDVAVPVLNWEQALQDDFLMTLNQDTITRGTTAAQTDIEIVTATHEMAAGLTGVVTIAPNTSDFSWGVPGAAAVVIAKTTDGSDPAHAVIYGYDKDATLIDGTTKAPARRAHFLMTDATFSNLNADGKKLFDAAVAWAMGGGTTPPPPQITTTTLSGGNINVTWTGGGTLEWTSEFLPNNGTVWTSTNDSDGSYSEAVTTAQKKFFRVRR